MRRNDKGADKKPWGGRFLRGTNRDVEIFTASIHIDKALYPYDIKGSIAHAQMLAKQRIISRSDEKKIIRGLQMVQRDIEHGDFDFIEGDEDIHMAIERALIGKIGDVGGKLHTARSRNDQITLDMRLYLREKMTEIESSLSELKGTLVSLAEREIETIMPGYTHLQKAQPVLLSHYLLAFWEMLDRDDSRLRDARQRTNIMPLGAAALAGTGLNIDRSYTAKLLQFPLVSQNSMDAVSDRDFIIEFISASAMIMMHLSRFSEDLIIWSTEEFAFVEMDDAFTTGSSIMPQKKNPDVAELVRGKTARVYGNLLSLLVLLKGLPMTYNRDLQEDKEPLFDTVETVQSTLSIFNSLLNHLTFNRVKMCRSASDGFSTATDVAEYLVKKGVSFRSAHGIVGQLVAFCIKKRTSLSQLTLKEYHRFSEVFDEDIYHHLSIDQSIAARNGCDGTSPASVRIRIAEIKKERKSKKDAS